ASVHACSYPRDAEAVLLVEVEGLKEGLPPLIQRITALCEKNHAKSVRLAESEEERLKFWKGRKGAFAAMGSISPNYVVQDGVVPRTRLPEVMRIVGEIGRKYSLSIANVSHMGDGNLHPLVLFDAKRPGETERAIAASEEIIKACITLGGAVTGEHGVGIEKRDLMAYAYSEAELNAMRKLKQVFDPQGLCNPGKVLPVKSTSA
ncbi:MAG: FAD-linked oxidase C-terminal domain-containing protein, partial [Candidatus Bathyarchaeia archaeon]